MQNFTPVSALLGGAFIGLSAALLWLLNGRIAGVSGILAGLGSAGGDAGWRLAFLTGLVGAPWLYAAAVGGIAPASITSSLPLLVAGGFLVGFGTRLGGGCTSGHGVCGVARLSPRSLVATLIFMAAGFLTVFLARQAFGS